MAKIHVVGASVGAAVARCIEKIVLQLPKYRSVENHCKSGAKYFGLKWPHPSELSREDVLIIFPCGNDLQTGFYDRETKGSRAFHLIEFKPATDAAFDRIYTDLQATLIPYVCKILVVTSFYRFLCPCHIHPRLIPYIKKRNIELTNKISFLPNVQVLDHRILVSEKVSKVKRDPKKYMALLRDGIHFKDNNIIAKRICGYL